VSVVVGVVAVGGCVVRKGGVVGGRAAGVGRESWSVGGRDADDVLPGWGWCCCRDLCAFVGR
jgi:hypothetical protein